MKYQIYLNKEASDFVNKLAESSSKKPATIIKAILESFIIVSKPYEDKIAEEVKRYDKTKR